MGVLAIARFRFLTIVRTGTPIFILGAVPALLAMAPLSVAEPTFRATAERLLPINANASLAAWLLHGILLGLATLSTGKVKSPHNDVVARVIPDLMDTAPVAPPSRFWGEALGTLGAAAIVHACCLPLLAAVAVLSPMPTAAFVSIEIGTLAFLALAAAGAAWQRRAPRTKWSATRGTRNAVLVGILLLLSVRVSTTQWDAFRDALAQFVFPRTSMQTWADVARAVDRPMLLAALVAMLYAGTIAYYYVSATRKRALEN
jgi:hypothetical protein